MKSKFDASHIKFELTIDSYFIKKMDFNAIEDFYNRIESKKTEYIQKTLHECGFTNVKSKQINIVCTIFNPENQNVYFVSKKNNIYFLGYFTLISHNRTIKLSWNKNTNILDK